MVTELLNNCQNYIYELYANCSNKSIEKITKKEKEILDLIYSFKEGSDIIIINIGLILFILSIKINININFNFNFVFLETYKTFVTQHLPKQEKELLNKINDDNNQFSKNEKTKLKLIRDNLNCIKENTKERNIEHIYCDNNVIKTFNEDDIKDTIKKIDTIIGKEEEEITEEMDFYIALETKNGKKYIFFKGKELSLEYDFIKKDFYNTGNNLFIKLEKDLWNKQVRLKVEYKKNKITGKKSDVKFANEEDVKNIIYTNNKFNSKN